MELSFLHSGKARRRATLTRPQSNQIRGYAAAASNEIQRTVSTVAVTTVALALAILNAFIDTDQSADDWHGDGHPENSQVGPKPPETDSPTPRKLIPRTDARWAGSAKWRA